MGNDIEKVVRDNFANLIAFQVAPDDLDFDLDMGVDYELTSFNKILFLTMVCEDAGVELDNFTAQGLTRMRTLRDVTDALARQGETAE